MGGGLGIVRLGCGAVGILVTESGGTQPAETVRLVWNPVLPVCGSCRAVGILVTESGGTQPAEHPHEASASCGPPRREAAARAAPGAAGKQSHHSRPAL